MSADDIGGAPIDW